MRTIADRSPIRRARSASVWAWRASRRKRGQAGELDRIHAASVCTAQQSTRHLSLHHALRQLPPNFDSAADPALLVQRLTSAPRCCRPALFKVRHIIRGALNPYILPLPAPDTMPRCTAFSPHAPTAWLPQDSCIRLPDLDSHNPVQSPALASVLAYGVLLSETQYRQWRLILACWRTSGGVYTTLRYTLP